MASPATRFAALAVTLLVAHQLGDYWIQTSRQAANKQLPGWPGRRACLSHVTSYTLTATAATVGIDRLLQLDSGWRALLAGQLVSAATHYFADRGGPLRRLTDLLGKRDFYDHGGAAALDQSFHVAWLGVAALLTAALGGRGARPRTAAPTTAAQPR